MATQLKRSDMKKVTLALSFALLVSVPAVLLAEATLPQNLKQIDALQRRADALTYNDQSPNNYHLAKARAWLDMATSEYHQTDTSGALPAAITQAETLISALENKQASINTVMPVDFPGSENIRPDLWEKIATLKSATLYTCGQRPLAESEVQLIWAGHEKVESGWSHAEAYARVAENSITEAQAAISVCKGMAPVIAAPTVPVVTVVAPAPDPIAPTHVLEKITLSADALFDFDKATLTSYSKVRLDKLVRDIQKIKSLEEVILVGHTDRLRTDKKYQRNQILSEKRAQRIKQYLLSKGLPANKISAHGVGSKQPVVTCSKKPSKAKQIICLQPNRRVEIILRGVK